MLLQMQDVNGLYIHVPFCVSKCRYCGFYSEPVCGYDSGAVVDSMVHEIGRMGVSESIKTIYIGGGSPSCLGRDDLLRLVSEARRIGRLAGEFSVEVNPGQVDKGLLFELFCAGVNRLSVGGQSFVQEELDFLGRGHSVDDIYRVVEEGREAGFGNISVDLIFAVPGSSIEAWERSVAAVVGLGVEHVSAYSLSYEDGTELFGEVERGEVERVSEDVDRAMYEAAIDRLGEAGIEQYEISNFARRGFECRHNLNYWANGSYAGIGPGAGWYVGGVRGSNAADIKRYSEAINSGASAAEVTEKLSGAERACETAVLNLRRRSGIDIAEFKEQTGFDAMELFGEVIGKYERLGLMGNEGGRIFLTREALGIADSVLCDFASV